MNVFVYADFAQLETWLTAAFSGDPIMQGELEDSLAGGYKIHAKNAALLYGIDPGDAKTHMVNFKGRTVAAYDPGKRLGHAFNYRMGISHMSKTFWLTKRFATEAYGKLAEKYCVTVKWGEDLVNEVFGLARYVCPGCGAQRIGVGGACITGHPYPIQFRYDGWEVVPTRELRTPFGRRRLYPGRRRDGANAVVAQKPQSTGASVWFNTLHRLNGFEVNGGVASEWPMPDCPVRVVTGTYDSFLLECALDKAPVVLDWLLWTMEQPWPQLDGRRFPAEGAIGYNWGEQSDKNPRGLVKQTRQAFTSSGPVRAV